MLYNLIQLQRGKETIFMTNTFPKVRARQRELRASQRGQNLSYVIRPAGSDEEKYKRPPSLAFDPSGDVDTRKYRAHKHRAKQAKKRNP